MSNSVGKNLAPGELFTLDLLVKVDNLNGQLKRLQIENESLRKQVDVLQKNTNNKENN